MSPEWGGGGGVECPGLGRIFTTGIIMELHLISIELLEWDRTFSDFWGKKIK